MRKQSFIIVLITLLAACDSSSDSPVAPPAGKGSISFDGAQTRAPLSSVSATFGLHGTATNDISGTTVTVFNNQKVTYDSGNSIWTYSPLKYWEPRSDHQFAAYAPYNATRSLSFSSEGYPMITNFTVQSNVDNQESLLLSRSVERNIGGGGLDMSPVVFTFDPALTKINFEIKKDAAVLGTINLNALRIYKLKSAGNCVHNGSQIIWDISAAPTNTFGYSTNFANAQPVTTEGITTWTNGILMVPQQISGISVYLSYTHRPSNVTYSYTKDNIALPGTDWQPGKQITYMLTLKPENNIEIGEPIVEPWIESSTSGGTIIVN